MQLILCIVLLIARWALIEFLHCACLHCLFAKMPFCYVKTLLLDYYLLLTLLLLLLQATIETIGILMDIPLSNRLLVLSSFLFFFEQLKQFRFVSFVSQSALFVVGFDNSTFRALKLNTKNAINAS